jgi:NADH:ubiquinone oxidoreductase subunit 2 (subunit N)
MALFRMFLAGCLLVIIGYTAVTMANHGAGLIPVFFGDMAAMAWPGQFNLDFFTFLLLSGIWVAWRHHFSAAGLGLAVVAVLGGMMFLSAYLLIVSFRTGGDIRKIMLGETRAAQR